MAVPRDDTVAMLRYASMSNVEQSAIRWLITLTLVHVFSVS